MYLYTNQSAATVQSGGFVGNTAKASVTTVASLDALATAGNLSKVVTPEQIYHVLPAAGAFTMNLDEAFSNIRTQSTSSGGFAITTPTAALMVGRIYLAAIGAVKRITIFNDASGQTATLTGGTTVTITGTATIANNTSAAFDISFTNVTAASEAVTYTRVGTAGPL